MSLSDGICSGCGKVDEVVIEEAKELTGTIRPLSEIEFVCRECLEEDCRSLKETGVAMSKQRKDIEKIMEKKKSDEIMIHSSRVTLRGIEVKIQLPEGHGWEESEAMMGIIRDSLSAMILYFDYIEHRGKRPKGVIITSEIERG